MTEPLVQLRAGRLVKEPASNVLKPDVRKGLVQVLMDDQGLVHFQWKERDAAGEPTGDPEIDFITFPGEAAFEKIDRPGSRVFALKFPAEPDRNLFFWAQEPRAEADAPFVQAVNTALNSVMDGMNEEVEATAEPTATPASGSAPPSSSIGIGAGALAAALAAMQGGAAAAGTSAGGGGMYIPTGPSLGDVLKAERIVPLLRDPELVERVVPYLPEGHRSPEAMAEILHSPQFKHQLYLLTQALATGQVESSQFGLGPAAFGVTEFLKAIQRQADEERAQQTEQQQQQGEAEGSGPQAMDTTEGEGGGEKPSGEGQGS